MVMTGITLFIGLLSEEVLWRLNHLPLPHHHLLHCISTTVNPSPTQKASVPLGWRWVCGCTKFVVNSSLCPRVSPKQSCLSLSLNRSHCTSIISRTTGPHSKDVCLPASPAGHQICALHRRSITGFDNARGGEGVPRPNHRHQEDGRPDYWQHVFTDWPEGEWSTEPGAPSSFHASLIPALLCLTSLTFDV